MSNEDIAQDVELAEWRRRNELRRPQPIFKTGDAGYGPELCSNEDCEDIMPESRRADGCALCTSCAELQERHQKKYSRP